MQEVGEERRHTSIPTAILADCRQGCGKRDAHPAVRIGRRAGDRPTTRRSMGETVRDHVGAPSRKIRASLAASSAAHRTPVRRAPLAS